MSDIAMHAMKKNTFNDLNKSILIKLNFSFD